MRIIRNHIFYLFFFIMVFSKPALLFSQKGFSQENIATQSEDTLFEDAEFYFNEKNYLSALELYSQLYQRFPDRVLYRYKLGICYIYKSDEADNAIFLLEGVAEKDPAFEEVDYFLARAYHINLNFDKSLEVMERVKKNKKNYKKRKDDIDRLAEMCANGKQLVQNKITAGIKNLGQPVNTEGSEYVPIITSDESVMIFTYKGPRSTGGRMDKYGKPNPRGEYFEDIFITYRIGDKWYEPEGIGENINTPGHDAAIALSSDGQKLFVYKDTEENSGDIYMSYLEGDVFSIAIPLNENVNSKLWDGSACLSSDEKLLYFSSERPGGQGKRDIWVSQRMDDGTWGKAENLGSKINSPYHDDAPFIHPDGKTLYFSSEGRNSMGGYDIFKSLLQEDGGWSEATNIGYPINTPGDDKYYVEASNGQRAYYSSGKLGGYGLQDIYVITYGTKAKEPAVALVKGIVTVNNKPVKALLTVNDVTAGAVQGVYNSNAATGKYLINLPTRKNYRMVFSLDSFPNQEREVKLESVDTFSEITIDIKLFTPGFDTTGRIAMAAKVYYDNDPAHAAAGIGVQITNPGKIGLGKTVTNEFGRFNFNLLPAYDQYSLALDATDPVLQKNKNTTIEGNLTSNDSPKPGIHINEVTTDTAGFFRLEMPPLEMIPSDRSKLDSIDLTDPRNYPALLEKYGDASADGMIFKVQVAAYFDPGKFNYGDLKTLGQVKTQKLDDGITRFTIGEFKTLREAESLRLRAISKGATDAFIIIFYNGQRKIWADVIRENFYQGK